MTEAEQRNHQGRLLVALTPNTDPYILRRAGEILEVAAGAEGTDRFNAPEIRFWDYSVRGLPVSLQWERDIGLGLAAGAIDPNVEQQTRELAKALAELLRREGLIE